MDEKKRILIQNKKDYDALEQERVSYCNTEKLHEAFS